MELIKLLSHQALITEPSATLTSLAAFLELTADIDMSDDHVFISDSTGDLYIGSFFMRRDTDVFVPNEVFCEILMDIKAGITVLEAFNKQGYTFTH